MKLVYVAGPYTNPDPIENTNRAIREADAIYEMSGGELVPIIPHLTAFWHLVTPHEYSHWLEYDLKVMSRCDIVYRMSGASSGADGEIAEADKQGIPVVFSLQQLFSAAA